MGNAKRLKGFTTMVATVCIMMLISATVSAATKEILKDGAFQNAGFINAGQVVDGTIQGPGNWTQLNLGDAAIDAAYLHIIMKASGETGAAQIVISDKYTVNLVDLGITLYEDYQDVVLPVGEQKLDMLSWTNFMGLDGGSSVYTIKDIFLSDDGTPTIAAAPVEDVSVGDTTPDVPKTGSTNSLTYISLIGVVGFGIALVVQKKYKKI